MVHLLRARSAALAVSTGPTAGTVTLGRADEPTGPPLPDARSLWAATAGEPATACEAGSGVSKIEGSGESPIGDSAARSGTLARPALARPAPALERALLDPPPQGAIDQEQMTVDMSQWKPFQWCLRTRRLSSKNAADANVLACNRTALSPTYVTTGTPPRGNLRAHFFCLGTCCFNRCTKSSILFFCLNYLPNNVLRQRFVCCWPKVCFEMNPNVAQMWNWHGDT